MLWYLIINECFWKIYFAVQMKRCRWLHIRPELTCYICWYIFRILFYFNKLRKLLNSLSHFSFHNNLKTLIFRWTHTAVKPVTGKLNLTVYKIEHVSLYYEAIFICCLQTFCISSSICWTNPAILYFMQNLDSWIS